MAEFNAEVQSLLSNVDATIFNPNQDLRQFNLDPNKDEYHTHTLDDIPQLAMLFNTGRIGDVYDAYDDNEGNGFILFSNRLLINYGAFTFDNLSLSTRVVLPLGYDSDNRNYCLQINKQTTGYNKWSYVPENLTYMCDDDRLFEQVDQTYNIYLWFKDAYSFEVKCNQLYIPERVSYNYFTIGLLAQ